MKSILMLACFLVFFHFIKGQNITRWKEIKLHEDHLSTATQTETYSNIDEISCSLKASRY